MAWHLTARLWAFFGKFRITRYGQVHFPTGAINFAIYHAVFYLLVADELVATIAGHAVHTVIGYFGDRYYVYRALDVCGKVSWWRYVVVELLVFTLIGVLVWATSDLVAAWWWHEVARWGIIAPIASVLHYQLNMRWTFKGIDISNIH